MTPKRKPKVLPELSRKNNSEKVVAQNLLKGFSAGGSRGEALIEQIMQQDLKKASRIGLIQLGSIVGELIGKPFPRNFKRKRDLIVKWFQDNEEFIAPYVPCLQVEFCDVNEDLSESEDENENITPKPNS